MIIVMMCSNTEADFVSSGLEETMLVSWENVRCTATQMVKDCVMKHLF